MKEIKIVVYGLARSGKTTVCNYLQNKLNCNIYDFGDTLRKITEELFPETKIKKDRTKLQFIGQTIRELDEDVWIKDTFRRIEQDKNPVILITGLRQKNEEEALRKNNFIFIKIEADDIERIRRSKKENDVVSEKAFKHETEQYIDKIKADYIINNNKDIKYLQQQLNLIIEKISKEDI